VSALSQRIANANHEGLTSRAVVKRAAEFGIKVSHGTIANIFKGSHGTLEDNTLRALERVFGIPFAELRQLVGLGPEDEPWDPPAVASRLSTKQRRLVESLIHELVRPDDVDDDTEILTLTTAEATALMAVARGTASDVPPKVAESLRRKGLAVGSADALSPKRPSTRS
jgi:hypothetical protein